MKFPVKDFFSKCDQIHSILQIWSHLLKKSLMEKCFSALFPLNQKHMEFDVIIGLWFRIRPWLVNSSFSVAQLNFNLWTCDFLRI